MKYPMKTSNKFNFIILLCCYLLILSYSSAAARAMTLPETAKLLPPETALLIDIHDFSRLKSQFQKTDFYKLYKDPAMKSFFEDFKTRWQQNSKMQKNKAIELLSNVDMLPEGRIALAIVLNERLKETKEPPFVIIIQWGQNINKIKEISDKMVKKAVEDGAHRKTESYRGVDITTMIYKSPKTYNHCFIENCFIGAVDLDVMKFVIAHIKGASSNTLSDDSDYLATMRTTKLQNAEHINCFVNIKQIIKTEINNDTEGKVKKVIGNLGIDNVTSLGLAFGPHAAQNKSTGASIGKAFLKINGQKKGVTKMLEMEPAPLRTPRFLSDSAYAVSFANLNFKNAFSELTNILNSFSPQFAAMMYMPLIPASPQGEPPVQIKTGIIDHLGSQLIVAQTINEPVSNTETKEPETSLTAIAIENRQVIEKSLSLLHNKIFAANNPNASRQILGHTIYVIDLSALLPGIMAPPTRPMQNLYGRGVQQREIPKMPKFAFTVTDTHLIFSKEAAVEKAIRTLNSTENRSMDSTRWFNIAKSAVPSLAGMVTLQNDKVSGKYIWSQMRDMTNKATKKDSDSEIKLGVGVRPGSSFPQMMFSQTGVQMFDFSLLPEFDIVKKYFGLSAFYGLSKPDGFFFELKYLNPPDID